MYRSAKRDLVGFVSAWLVSVFIGFLAGCFYALYLGSEQGADFMHDLITDTSNFAAALFYVGTVVAIAAGVIGLFAEVFIAWPLYLVVRKRGFISLWQHLVAGLAIALIVIALLFTLQYLFHGFPRVEYWFEGLSILVATILSTLAFWYITVLRFRSG